MPAEPTFDFGPERRELEERWPPEVSRACALLVTSLPVGLRAHAKRALFEAVSRNDSTRGGIADLDQAWAALTQSLVIEPRVVHTGSSMDGAPA